MKQPPDNTTPLDPSRALETSTTTSQARAQQAPQEQRQILESVFAGIGECVVVTDERGRFVLFNPAAEQLLGHGAMSVPIEQWPERYGICLPDQVTPYPAEALPLVRAIRGEAMDRVELFLRNATRPEGAWLLVTARPLRDEGGALRGAVAIFNEVTELKQAQEALRKSKEKYRSLYNNTPVMMHSIDREGRLISVSDCWLKTLGYERSEVLGRRSVEFLTPECRRYAQEVVLPEYFQAGKCEDVPYQFVKKSGEIVDVLLSAIAERDAQGAIVRSLAVLIDVTERKRTELAHRFLAEASRELVTSLDCEATLQNVAELAVPTVAEACIIFLGAEDGSLRPVAVADAVESRAHRVREFLEQHPLPVDSLLGPAQVMSTGQPQISPAGLGPLGHADPADRRWEPLQALRRQPCLDVPLRAGGRCFGVLSLSSPRSFGTYGPADLALAEELGRRVAFSIENAQLYRKAQESIRARDEFLSIASHELKTPLTSMKLRVQQLERALQQQHPEGPLAQKVSDTLGVFQNQMRRLTHLVDHLLDVSRVNQDRMDLRREQLDLTELAQAVSDHLKEQLDRSGCTLELEATKPVIGEWDRLRLEQVMINLLTNAMKYGAGQPIRVKTVPLEAHALLIVSDDGIGIPREAQDRIFERFERAASHNYGGLGLGLFITRKIVEAHGGRIRVESVPPRGATFFVELPYRPRQEPARPACAPGHRAG